MSKIARTFRKQASSRSCFDLALERLHHVFERFDQISVSFSGGKDSTTCLNLALQVATETKRLPLTVITFDEEAIPPETVEYTARVAARPDVAFQWWCVPIEHRNTCSEREPYWYPWAPEARAKWVRDLPAGALQEDAWPGTFRRIGIAELMPALFPRSKGTACAILGIRTQESLSRFHAIAAKPGPLAFMTRDPQLVKAYPIYDWNTEDVWLAPQRLGWDYNRAYDLMEAAGITRPNQRCAPPFGEQSIRRLHTYQTCWPELWAKMTDRVIGAATAARYANTELYGHAVGDDDLPAGLTWRQHTMQTLAALTPKSRLEASKAIKVCLSVHHREAGGRAVPDAEPDDLSGFCWKMLYTAAKVGGNKFDRQQQKIVNRAIANRRKSGH